MPAAAKPANETQRLCALEEYCILDSNPEAAYNNITNLAALICNTPIAVVSLVAEDRQWFKAKTGLDAAETPRDVAFCAHAILAPEEALVVEDATKDPRFSDNILVLEEPKIRFYAGIPLQDKEGMALGTLCVIDTKPRTIEPHQLQALEVLADHVVTLLELRKVTLERAKLIENFLDNPTKSDIPMSEFLEALEHRLSLLHDNILDLKTVSNNHDESVKEHIFKTSLRQTESLLTAAKGLNRRDGA